MGCCGSSDPAEQISRETTKEIEAHIGTHKKADAALKKLLLLGAGSSGKSTLFRQLKCIHGWGLEDEDLDESRHNSRQNIVGGMLTLLAKCAQFYDQNPMLHRDLFVDIGSNPDLQSDIECILPYEKETFQDPERLDWHALEQVGKAIKRLWALPAIKKTYSMRYNRFAIVENLDHFFEKADEVMSIDYNPEHKDVLLTRIRTTGIVERTYELQENFFSLVDVGGQRNERKKWIHQFSKVTAVIFVAALNHYNTVLFEDETKNSMHESLELFKDVCNSKWFKRTEIILFLNKDDLFQRLLRQEKSLAACFTDHPNWKGEQWVPNYGGPRNTNTGANEYFVPEHLKKHYVHFEPNENEYVEETEEQKKMKQDASLQDVGLEEQESFFEHCHNIAIAFIERQYIAQNQISDKRAFVHVTTATDRDNVEKVFWDVQDIVIRSNLRYGGFV